ncbi:MAG: helix-turn-helix transcriptional regulator [Deltaproteobacteria bacterium]|nr:helix-turn-helix transcriptional regulator [Deltaproteobacteria bacterium]
MTIRWNFKSYLANSHGIYTVTELKKLITKKTGYVISVANLCKYVNQRPSMLRLETAEIICTALDCNLSDFLKISPKKIKSKTKKKLSYKNTPKSKVAVKSFPNPEDYKQ